MQKEKQLFPKDPENAKTPWLWLGTWSMGGEGFGPHDERESLRVLHRAVENDVRYFDTAGFYAHGKSERLMQKIIQSERKEFFISTKGGLVWEGRKVEHRASPRDLKSQLHESLNRLKTDYLDLYQLHWPDPHVPVAESINALKEFQREGLVRFWGAGNLTARQLADNLAGERDVPHQVHFNPIHKDRPVLMAGKDSCINCIVSPLEQGLLAGQGSNSGSTVIGKNDIRRKNPYFTDEKVTGWTRRLDELMEGCPVSKVSLVLMWICAQPHVHAVIPGPRRVEQLDEIIRFKSEIEIRGLLAPEEYDSILAEDRVKKTVTDELWQHLCAGVQD